MRTEIGIRTGSTTTRTTATDNGSAISLSVIDQPTRSARDSGSIARHAPQSQITRIRVEVID
jgi:hypothetical protein